MPASRTFKDNKKIVVLGLFALVEAGFLVFLWIHTYSVIPALAGPLHRLTTFVLTLLLISIAGLGGWLFLRRNTIPFSPSSRSAKLMLLGILLVALCLRLGQPLEHYAFADEERYIWLADMIRHTGEPIECEFGAVTAGEFRCFGQNHTIYTLQKGYPLLLAGLFELFDEKSDLPAFFFNLLLGVLTPLLAFFFVKTLWSERAGLFAAAFTATVPEHIRWSVPATTDIPTLFVLLLGLVCFAHFARQKVFGFFPLSLLLVSYASFMRTEMFLVIPFLLLYTIIDKDLRKLAVETWGNVWTTALASLFLALNVVSVVISRKELAYMLQLLEEVVGRESRAAFSFGNFSGNVAFLFANYFAIRHVLFLIILLGVLVGLYRYFRLSPRLGLLGTGIPLAFFLLYMAWIYGVDPQGGTIHSHSAAIWLPLWATVAGVGLEGMVSRLEAKWRNLSPLLLLAFLVVLLAWNRHNFFVPSTQASIIREGRARLAFESRNPQCLYVAPTVYKELHRGYNAISYSTFEHRAKSGGLETPFNGYPCVVFFESELCRTSHRKSCEATSGLHPWAKLPYERLGAWVLPNQGGPPTLQLPTEPAQTLSVFAGLRKSLAGEALGY